MGDGETQKGGGKIKRGLGGESIIGDGENPSREGKFT